MHVNQPADALLSFSSAILGCQVDYTVLSQGQDFQLYLNGSCPVFGSYFRLFNRRLFDRSCSPCFCFVKPLSLGQGFTLLEG